MASTHRAPANGVLPVTANQTSGNAPKPASKPSAPRLKVMIRRLPPALTEAEFFSVLGEDWNLAQGKVDWFLYKPGKDSKDPSKPSRPSRAYLHLTSDDYLMSLSDIVRQSVFEDAQNTFNSPCLIGPPTVEFAPYGRTPGGRRRVDARAGTIDQDAEFMAFLEGLANPATGKEASTEALVDGAPATKEKVTMTPLVQFIKDKKSSKSREAAVKAAKKQEAHLAKGKGVKDSPEKKGKGDKMVEKAAKEAVKILNREASTKSGASSSSTKSDSSESSGIPKLDLGKVPGRQKAAVTQAHIRMLQRDLGLSPAQASRQVKRDNDDAKKAERAAEKSATETNDAVPSQSAQSAVPTAPKGSTPQVNSRRNRAKGTESEAKTSSPNTTPSTPTPMVLLKKPEAVQTTPTAPAARPAPTVAPRKPQAVAASFAGATQAFVKHANPSQGVTEPLLKEAMEKFGAVSHVEIDKRKGFAYVDFNDSEGLKKAMAANPISVAQGTVHVMQRKGTSLPPEKKPAHAVPHPAQRGGGRRGGTIGRRGGRGAGRGGGNAAPSSAPTGPAAKG
ncbi:Regulator of nonsense transcripts UPF3 [Lachnellula suecica]|uniref:Regulator of nonsense transcripts UPF3 n=1 Tax=Lachnellula suecica TaxID=602035 RepID=A0A8T9CEH0_9HELO|nr:Regulator of nonsense transcripts UPF3 [Lachnellula suecica]